MMRNVIEASLYTMTSVYVAGTLGINLDPEPICCTVICSDKTTCYESLSPSSEAFNIAIGTFVFLMAVGLAYKMSPVVQMDMKTSADSDDSGSDDEYTNTALTF
jgi:hypothetical protein